ncbi:arsenate reductase family protein [Paenibacillus spongiae]|uniref:Arsenate reductase family protein n=1 Tax=Paenibacillus spongiae TaxID=2909671 RepID=A0ABY5S8N9_9BACL|nr:arsenate reductase family protein [Paenibacillus spongiae]UVI28693.1 arsenate reductase family protein [Paenibacillus spongiae]
MKKSNRLTVYEYPRCGTCRSASKWLKAKGYEIEAHNIFETAPPAETIEELIAKSGLDIKKFFNTSGEVYKELGLKDKLAGMSHREKVELLASNGRLIRRPIVVDGDRITVGFKEDEYDRVWD